VDHNPRDAVPSGLRVARVVTSNSFINVLAGTYVPSTRLGAAENVNVEHLGWESPGNFLGPPGFEPGTS
jgi:hypothetical protein